MASKIRPSLVTLGRRIAIREAYEQLWYTINEALAFAADAISLDAKIQLRTALDAMQ